MGSPPSRAEKPHGLGSAWETLLDEGERMVSIPLYTLFTLNNEGDELMKLESDFNRDGLTYLYDFSNIMSRCDGWMDGWIDR